MSDKYFTDSELKEYKELIIKKKDYVLGEIQAFTQEKKNENIDLAKGDSADIASGEIDNMSKVRLLEKHRKLLSELNHALSKFDDGSYGVCEGTGEYISKERLKAHPWTKYSLEYKEDKEREDKRKKLNTQHSKSAELSSDSDDDN